MTEIPDALSAAIRKIVKKGQFTHLSIVCADGLVFKAAFNGTEYNDQRHAEHEDPVEALMEVLTGRRAAPRKVEKPARKKSPKPIETTKVDDFEDMLS